MKKRVALGIVLTIAVAVSIWFAGPVELLASVNNGSSYGHSYSVNK